MSEEKKQQENQEPQEPQQQIQQEPQQQTHDTEVKVPVWGYISLIFAIIFFSGIFAQSKGWITAFDFTVISGKFGSMQDAANFMGRGGAGARDGFLFALTLAPVVMFALGVVQLVDHLGGLKAAQKMLTPLLRPLMGIPGISGLALISSLQSTDAGAGMTKGLRDSKLITEREKTTFAAFQFSGGAPITNYFSSGAALFAFLTVPIIIPLAVIFIMKVVGANIVRFYLMKFDKEGEETLNG
jgi:nucleoside recognition membrane protein YjiH